MPDGNQVLVVEDDEDMAEVVTQVLQHAGYQPVSAANGREALDAVGKSMPALILLDMLMPVMDGWEFAREFRRRHGPAVPIVVVTAAEHAGQRAEEIGANDFLSKPFDVQVLLKIVARHHPAQR